MQVSAPGTARETAAAPDKGSTQRHKTRTLRKHEDDDDSGAWLRAILLLLMASAYALFSRMAGS